MDMTSKKKRLAEMTAEDRQKAQESVNEALDLNPEEEEDESVLGKIKSYSKAALGSVMGEDALRKSVKDYAKERIKKSK